MKQVGEPVQLLYGTSAIEGKLRNRLEQDLSFAGRPTAYAGHNTHAFAAKFPPQLPRAFIEDLTSPGELVLDPMAGSGTAVVEAAVCGRVGIGAALATAICDAKTRAVDPEVFAVLSDEIADHARLTIAHNGPNYAARALASFDAESSAFVRYWFTNETIVELAALRDAVWTLTKTPYRRLFEVLFSSIIVTKSGGVSLARDLAHSRPHRVEGKPIKSAIQFFAEKAQKLKNTLREVRSWPGISHVLRSDSRRLPLADETVDLVITSPPYANAIDYVRAHKFSLVWLGHSVQSMSRFRRCYIGAEVGLPAGERLRSETGNATVERIQRVDSRRAGVVRRYFCDMWAALREMHRVLKAGKAAVVVVGSSTVRGVTVPTAVVLAELGESAGFKVVGVKERMIDRDRRLMPVSRVSKKEGIEARMHGEEVIAFVKG